jgi:hypothetical protein
MTDKEPYFAKDIAKHPYSPSDDVLDVMFIDFLNKLHGPARVVIDVRQEMLVMALRSRCLKYALSTNTDLVIAAVNQLCGFYQQCAIKTGLRAFQILAAQTQECVKVQEQFYYSGNGVNAINKTSAQQVNSVLVHIHDLLEGFIRRLATFGTFSIDVIRGSVRAQEFTPNQYVDLDLREKERTFRADPSVLNRTADALFGSVRYDIRNAIAHKRYEVHEDGSVLLFDFDPHKKLRKEIGLISQPELNNTVAGLEQAADIFTISQLIFQHNSGLIMNQLGYYGGENVTYTEKEMREMVYYRAAACFMQIDRIEIMGDEVKIDASFLSFESRQFPSEVFANTKDMHGNPLKYKLPLPSRVLSARDQTLRLLQVAFLYCGNYQAISIRTKDIVGGEILGEVTASLPLLSKSFQEGVQKEEFLKRITINGFHDSK